MNAGLLCTVLLALPVSAQDKGRLKVDQAQVDAAIKKGVAYLRTADSHGGNGVENSDELILWTFVHAGMPESDPAFKALFEKMLAARLERTYKVGSHEWYVEGARFLLNAQRLDGSWLATNTTYLSPTWDTCFAILFLRRATRPLDVASVDRFHRK